MSTLFICRFCEKYRKSESVRYNVKGEAERDREKGVRKVKILRMKLKRKKMGKVMGKKEPMGNIMILWWWYRGIQEGLVAVWKRTVDVRRENCKIVKEFVAYCFIKRPGTENMLKMNVRLSLENNLEKTLTTVKKDAKRKGDSIKGKRKDNTVKRDL